MKAHLFNEGGGLVTGTHDVKAARRVIVEKRLEDQGLTLDEATREEIARASWEFPARQAVLEIGRIVPAGRYRYLSGDKLWFPGHKLGKPGVTKAVTWYA